MPMPSSPLTEPLAPVHGPPAAPPLAAAAPANATPELTARLLAAASLLERIAADRSLLAELPAEDRARFLRAAGEVYCPDVADRRRLFKAAQRKKKAGQAAQVEQVLNQTGIRSLRRKPVFTTPNVFPPSDFREIADAPQPEAEPSRREVHEEQNCYICKRDYREIHHFYDQLCPPCAELNYRKRTESADLRGRVALLTGGRVKIGYQAGIKLLRAGAELIVTTRFPRDSASRYAREPDFADWGHRLQVFGLDLRHTPSVEAFCQFILARVPRLDFIINNACQTVRRPPDFYRHMMEQETSALRELPSEVARLIGAYEGLRAPQLLAGNEPAHASLTSPAAALAEIAGLARSAELSQVALLPDDLGARPDLFPQGRLDQDLQQVDLRDRNSWRLLLHEVASVELLEVHLVNAIAPFILNARLKPLLLKTREPDKHIVNVSAVEGQFYRKFKTTRHPHTNMAKAALNMMTRTAAADYHADGIHMNSVDTGWVTDEDPSETAARKTRDHRFHPPLDIVDGAARIVDPILDGFNTGRHRWGLFFKDYKPTDW